MKYTDNDKRLGSAVDAYAHLLGKITDVEIAAMAGVTDSTVGAYRNRRRIAAAKRVSCAPSLGTSCLLCATPPHTRGLCSRCYMRCRYNGTLESTAFPPAKRGRKPMTVAVPVVIEVPIPVIANTKRVEYEHLLGKVSDAVIAQVYGLQRGAVSALRRRRGIPALTGTEAHWTTVGFKNFLASEGCTTQ